MQHYDLGFFRNWKTYGQYTPPGYDIRKVTSLSVLFHSSNDRIVDKQVKINSKILNNRMKFKRVCIIYL